MLTPTAIRVSRLLVGLAALSVGIVLLAASRLDLAVAISLISFGGFVLLNLLVDVFWARLSASEAGDQAAPAPDPIVPADAAAEPAQPVAGAAQEQAIPPTNPLREGAGTVVQVAGVVLGVAALATKVTPALRVGSLALAVGLLIALMLYGSVLLSPLPEPSAATLRRHALIRYLFNAALFALAFGLLSVAMSIAIGGK